MSIHDFERGLKQGIQLGESRGSLNAMAKNLATQTDRRGYSDIAKNVRDSMKEINAMSDAAIERLLAEEQLKMNTSLDQDGGSGI